MFSRLFVRARPSGVARHRIRAGQPMPQPPVAEPKATRPEAEVAEQQDDA